MPCLPTLVTPAPDLPAVPPVSCNIPTSNKFSALLDDVEGPEKFPPRPTNLSQPPHSPSRSSHHYTRPRTHSDPCVRTRPRRPFAPPKNPRDKVISEPPFTLQLPPITKIFALPSPKSDHFILEGSITVDNASVQPICLLDTGASGHAFIDYRFVKSSGLRSQPLPSPIPVSSVDGSPLRNGPITHFVPATFALGSHTENLDLYVTSLGHYNVVLGLPWIKKHNPLIDWCAGTLSFTHCSCGIKTPTFHHIHSVGLGTPRLIPSLLSRPNPIVVSSPVREYLLPAPPQQDPDVSTILCAGETDPNDPYAFLRDNPRTWLGPRATTVVEEIPLSVSSTEFSPTEPLPNDDDETPPDLSRIPEIFHCFADVFSKAKADKLPPHRPFDMEIDLLPGKTPPFGPIYSLTQPEQEELQRYITENLQKGFIRPSKSPAAAPVLFVKKKNGKLRLCVDYRGLNTVTIKNRYPIPLIHDLLDRVQGCKYFSKIDLQSAFNLLRIKPGHEWKTAFRTKLGLFEYLVMPFGLSNAPSAFQALVNDVLKDLIDVCVVVYLDDILIFSKTREEHERIVKDVLQRLRDANLFASPDKCEFFKDSIEFLGFVISKDGLSMDKNKITTITEWPTPTSLSQVQSFLGFANFYRRFIDKFSELASPLTRLTKKDVAWNWDSDCQLAFDNLKHAFTSAPILQHFDPSLPCTLTTDASDFAIAAILGQPDPEGALHPVAYYSRKLLPAESNYEIHDKELLGIVAAMKEWRSWLCGAHHTVQVRSDHKNLEYFMKSQPLNDRQSRWSMLLSEYDFVLTHKPGSKNMADAPSRRPDYAPSPNDKRLPRPPLLNSQHLRLIAPTDDTTHISSLQTFSLPPSDLLDDLKAAYSSDEDLQEGLKSSSLLGPDDIPAFKMTDDGLALHNGRVYIPRKLRVRILQEQHDSPAAGHPGRAKTFDLLSREYSWPGMRTFVRNYVASCDLCQRIKIPRHSPYGLLQPLPSPARPWSDIAIDMIVKLPISNGFDSILVIVDLYSKMGHFVPCHESMSSEELALLFLQHVFRYHGLPDTVTSDRGSTFVSEFTHRLYGLLGISARHSTSYHPQTNGQTERTNQTLETYLRAYCSYQQDNWADLLPLAEFSFNNTSNSSTKQTPFFANFGYHPRFTLKTSQSESVPAVEGFVERLRTTREELELELKHAKEDYQRYYNQHATAAPVFAPGDMVWLLRKNIKTRRPSDKLDFKRIGPFRVVERIGERDVYRLDLPSSMGKTHPVFNVVYLEPAIHPSTIPGRAAPPGPPLSIDDDESTAFEIIGILDSRSIRKRIDYFVAYRDQPISERSWIRYEDIPVSAHSLLRTFHSQYPDKPRPRKLLDDPDEHELQPTSNPSFTSSGPRRSRSSKITSPDTVPPHLLSYRPPELNFTRRGRTVNMPSRLRLLQPASSGSA
ncbi:hypothetical protein FRC01_005489 [Tulasnella sp. 417]|nr:hypothetical protein FRC01_005489 [Tulasnella sp. 417]